MASTRGTSDSMQKSLKLSIKWLVYFAKKLQETGNPTSECEELKLFSSVMDLSQRVDDDNHVDVFCSFSDALNIPFPSPIPLVTLDSEDSNTQNENSESSEIEITSPVMIPCSQPSSTSPSTRERFEGRSLSLKRTCPRGDSRWRTPDVVREHLPSNATPGTGRAGNSSLNLNAATIRFGDNEEIQISLPITPLFKEQSVKIRYDCDRVQVGYQRLRSDCSEAVSSSQTEESNSPPNPAKRSRIDSNDDVIILESDENDIAAPAPNENAVAIDPRDIPSCSYAPFLKLEGNRSAFIPAGRDASQEENIIHVDTDEDQEVLAPATELRFNHFGNASNLRQEVTCPEVAHALEQLADTHNDEELKMKYEQLKISLRNCTDAQASAAVNVALHFFCSRNVNPLEKYLTTNEKRHLFPRNEYCVVKAFTNINRSIFRNKLEVVLYEKIVKKGGKYNILVLSTLCRAWAYLRKVKKCILSARSMCYDLLKIYPNTAFYLIASILSVFTTALGPPNTESEEYLFQVFSYMIVNKPKDLPDNLWTQATHLIFQHVQYNTRLYPQGIIDAAVRNYMNRSSNVAFPVSDAKNYVTAIEIVSSLFDWSWVYCNVINKFMVPLIVAFSRADGRKFCGAVALAFRITGSLGFGQSETSDLKKTVKNAYALMSNKRDIPAFVFQEACYAVFLLETGRKEVGINSAIFKQWIVQNRYVKVPLHLFQCN